MCSQSYKHFPTSLTLCSLSTAWRGLGQESYGVALQRRVRPPLRFRSWPRPEKHANARPLKPKCSTQLILQVPLVGEV